MLEFAFILIVFLFKALFCSIFFIVNIILVAKTNAEDSRHYYSRDKIKCYSSTPRGNLTVVSSVCTCHSPTADYDNCDEYYDYDTGYNTVSYSESNEIINRHNYYENHEFRLDNEDWLENREPEFYYEYVDELGDPNEYYEY